MTETPPTSTPIIIAALAGAFLFSLLYATVTPRNVIVSHKKEDSIRSCLSPPGAPIGLLLEERAKANARLVKAFGLSNTFVEEDEGVHAGFVGKAKELLKEATRRGWGDFRDLARQAVRHELSEVLSGGTARVEFDALVQGVCLRVVLVGLLGVEASVESFAKEDVVKAASHINLLWALSKKPGQTPPHLLPELRVVLRRLVPDTEKYPNPVDFVIPAWETLWRVVAGAVAHAHEDDGMMEALEGLYERPGRQSFDSTSQGGVAVRNIINETMRVYPPSKHIGRARRRQCAMHLPSFVTKIIDLVSPAFVRRNESADVLAVQRASGVWGDDAHQFDASRYHRPSTQPMTRKQQEIALRYLFGAAPLRCVGASWAPIAAGVITSAIVCTVREEGLMIAKGKGIGGRDGWNGWFVESV